MALSVFRNEVSSLATRKGYTPAPFTEDAYRRIMNNVGMLFLREGIDFRTEAEKAAQIRHDLAKITGKLT